ncbi:hypothetical protein J2Z35_002517 [Acetoanaerobium pronyense]|uniref:Uncharacterized protein n=1 Tax=Acetoanaerobium pronyense TaxID=1482736 RepID=A0ABS4KLM6_9FIRM|nr:phage tail protein [Acetoanaerobium pronyense]MBP2028687.1 hypothetical protein [Acetoanaerobium pronyense]
MLKIIHENQTEEFPNVITASIQKRINGNYTFSCDFLGEEHQMDKVKRGNLVDVDNNLFKIEEATKTHEGNNKVSFSIFAEHICYSLLDYDMDFEGDEDERIFYGTAREIIEMILLNTGFTLRNCIEKYGVLKLSKRMNKKEALLKAANEFECEILFDRNEMDFLDLIGETTSFEIKYKSNLKGISVIEHHNGVRYEVDYPELYLLDEYSSIGTANLGDSILVKDEVLNIDIRTRVIQMQYNPFRKIEIKALLGCGIEHIKEEIDWEKNVEERIDELEKRDFQQVTQIVEVFHEEVKSADVVHVLNAWIRNLFVENLQTNFNAIDPRISTEEYRSYIEAKEMGIKFKKALLSEGNDIDLVLPDGSNVYWTAIGENPDAYQYFTITSPSNFFKKDPNLSESENEILRQEFIESFKVKIKESLVEATLLKIEFEAIPGNTGGGVYPVMTWGQGDGTELGQKGFIYKDTTGFYFQYYKNNNNLAQIKFDSDGVSVLNENGDMSKGQLRNIHVTEDLSSIDEEDILEGDIVCVIGGD